METYLAIFAIVGALLVGAMSPGPSFILIVQTSAASSRKNGLSMALGLGVGSAIFGLFALLGLQALFEKVEILYWSFKLLGGCYLLYLAYNIWKGASGSLAIDEESKSAKHALHRSFLLGLTTQLSNPKTAIVFASVFATFLNSSLSLWEASVLISLIFLSETLWYGLVAMGFSALKPRQAYLNLKTTIDRFAAGIIAVMGLKLLLSRS